MKKYISNGRDYMVFVRLNGDQVPVRFHDLGAYEGKGVFVTDNAALASALERHPRFNECFFLVEDDSTMEVVPEAEEDTHIYHKVYDYVARTQTGIEVLVKEYGVKRSEVKTLDDVLRKAVMLNISFPRLNAKQK